MDDSGEVIGKKPWYKQTWFIITAIVVPIVVIIVIVVPVVLVSKKKSDDEKTSLSYRLCKNNEIGKCKGAWFYNKNPRKKPRECAMFAKSQGWNFVFLSLGPDKSAIQLVNNFTELGISVHWMNLQDTFYLDNLTLAYEEVTNHAKFAKDNNLKISGFHIDCEPHAYQKWNDCKDVKCQNKIFKDYIKIIEESKKIIKSYDKDWCFSTAVAWWYPRKVDEGLEDGDKLTADGRLDFVVPMIYDGAGKTSEQILRNMKPYLVAGSNEIVGMALKEFSDPVTEEGVILYNKAMDEVYEQSKTNSYFLGFSTFSSHHYPSWSQS